MSVKVKRAVAAILFFSLLFYSIYQVQDLVTPKYDWPTRNRRSRKGVGSVLNESANSLDALFLGGSQTFCSISPMDMYDAVGLHGYNLATVGQLVPVGYYLAKMTMNKQSPKYVLADASGFFYTEPEVKYQGKWYEVMDAMPLSAFPTKLEMANELARLQGKSDDSEYKLNSMIPLMRSHMDYIMDEENYIDLHMNQAYQRKGYVATSRIIPVSDENLAITDYLLNSGDAAESKGENTASLVDALNYNRKYLEMLKTLCDQKGAELIFIKVPVCANLSIRGYWSAFKHDLVQTLADEMGVSFVDMNYEDVGIDWSEDSYDGTVHMNYAGARKVSAFLANWLTENRDFASVENSRLDRQWAYQSQLFSEEMAYIDLAMETDILDYLEHVKQGNYTLLTAVCNSLGDYWNDDMQARFTEVTGSRLDLRDQGCAAYVCVSSNGELIDEESDEDSCTVRGDLPGAIRFRAKSIAGDGKGHGRISIDGTNYACEGPGIHFVVYDNDLKCVIESICFNTNVETLDYKHGRKHEKELRKCLIENAYRKMKKM